MNSRASAGGLPSGAREGKSVKEKKRKYLSSLSASEGRVVLSDYYFHIRGKEEEKKKGALNTEVLLE